jgi:predicted DNA-binding transcriptional regulator AlpA
LNATSRAVLLATLTTDAELSITERDAIRRLISGEAENHLPDQRQPERLLVNQKSAAALLGVSRVTIWRMTKDGVLHPVEILPGTWRYRYAEISDVAHGRTNLNQRPGHV